MDPQRGKRMKVRLEIIDNDGTESANVEFAGRHWRKRLLAFLDTVEDETDTINEPSSISSYSEVQAAEQNAYPQQFVSQQAPSNIIQQPVQQAAPQQQPLPVQQHQMQPQVGPVSPQCQPVQQAPPQPQYQQVQPQLQQQGMPQQVAFVPQQQVYTQVPLQNYQSYSVPQYSQPNVPPIGLQQYGFGQPERALTSTVHPPVNANTQNPPAALYSNQPTLRKAPKFHERLNDTSLTINERLELFLKYEYPRVWFSSQDVQQHYERVYGDIKQSTVSTYLSRMFRKNLLERRGNRTQREYRYIGDAQEKVPVRIEEMSDVPVNNRLYY